MLNSSRPTAPARPVTLSETDLRLVHALQQTPRAAWVDVARRVGVGRDVAATRWRALYEARLAWATVYLGPRWWRTHQLAWVEQDVPAADLDAAVVELSATRRVLSLNVDLDAGGLLAAIAVADYRTAGRPLLSGLTKPRASHLATELHSTVSRWRIGALPDDSRNSESPSLRNPGAGPPEERVRTLAAVLGPDPRRPVTDIADACHVSYMTASRWLTHALAEGDLGIRIDVAPEVAVRPVGLHWWLRAPDSDHDALVSALLAQSDVRWVAGVLSTTGATVFAAAWTHDLAAARQLTARVADRCPTALTVRQVVTLQPVKRLGWLVDRETGRRGDYISLEV
jgi:DNA-binding Lrp family transcriptional regulator